MSNMNLTTSANSKSTSFLATKVANIHLSKDDEWDIPTILSVNSDQNSILATSTSSNSTSFLATKVANISSLEDDEWDLPTTISVSSDQNSILATTSANVHSSENDEWDLPIETTPITSTTLQTSKSSKNSKSSQISKTPKTITKIVSIKKDEDDDWHTPYIPPTEESWEDVDVSLHLQNNLPASSNTVDDWHESVLEKTDTIESTDIKLQDSAITTSFDRMGLKEEILRAIYEEGYENPSHVQQIALAPLVNNPFTDVVACAQAGSGKTLLYVVGALQAIEPSIKELQAIIIIPNKELGLQIFEYFCKIAKYLNVSIAFHRGTGQNIKPMDSETRITNSSTSYFKYGNARDGKEQVVVSTPGRLLDILTNQNGILVKKEIWAIKSGVLGKRENSDKIKIDRLNTNFVSFIGMDEADDMLSYQKKSSSREIIEKIFMNIATAQVARKMGVTATCSQEFLDFCDSYFDANHLLQFIIPKEELSVKSLAQYFIQLPSEEKKIGCLNLLFSKLLYGQAFIFTNQIEKAIYIYEKLSEENFPIACVHGRMTQADRDNIVKDFKKGKYRIVVSTDLLGRGIDIASISLVINYDLPLKIDNYIHRVGRAGRFGKKGMALNLILNDQRSRMEEIKLRFQIENLVESPSIDVLNRS